MPGIVNPQLFFDPQELLQPYPPYKITREPILYGPQIVEINTKCLNTTPATTSTLLISLLLTIYGMILCCPTRGGKFWNGYRHLNPRYGTRTFEPAGSMRWETGSFKLRNIGTGFVVFVEVNLMVQPCFATGVWGLARLTLGEREDIRRKKDIANKLRC